MNQSRRALLKGQPSRNRALWQPPWTGEDYTECCTRCGDCLIACPEEVLVIGDGGFPELAFRGDGCTFCGQCADTCPEPVFDRQRRAFPWVAGIGESCLARQGIHCQTCQDACEPRAIRFRPRIGGPPQPEVDTTICNGCVACAASCPEEAIVMKTVTSE